MFMPTALLVSRRVEFLQCNQHNASPFTENVSVSSNNKNSQCLLNPKKISITTRFSIRLGLILLGGHFNLEAPALWGHAIKSVQLLISPMLQYSLVYRFNKTYLSRQPHETLLGKKSCKLKNLKGKRQPLYLNPCRPVKRLKHQTAESFLSSEKYITIISTLYAGFLIPLP